MLAADVRGLRPSMVREDPHRSPRLPEREEMRKENQCRKWIAISEADSGGSSCAPRRLSTVHFRVFVALSFSPDSARAFDQTKAIDPNFALFRYQPAMTMQRMKSMAGICCLSMVITCVAAIVGVVLGYASVWGWPQIGDIYLGFICFGMALGLLTSLPVMTIALVVSQRNALLAVILGSLGAGTICGLACRIICWSFVHIT